MIRNAKYSNGLYISSKMVSVIQNSQIYWFVIQTC